ncbi:MAG TPA: hypothetical protein VKR83_09825 [Ktedonobacteraceae bacterium]|nr:hypothetical protein [Ktedonobacteraceae bacterium]
MEEVLSAQMGKLGIELSPERQQEIMNDPFLSEWNKRLNRINKIYKGYCEEHEIARYGLGDPSSFPQAVLDTCLQNGLLWYDNGRLTAKPRH